MTSTTIWLIKVCIKLCAQSIAGSLLVSYHAFLRASSILAIVPLASSFPDRPVYNPFHNIAMLPVDWIVSQLCLFRGMYSWRISNTISHSHNHHMSICILCVLCRNPCGWLPSSRRANGTLYFDGKVGNIWCQIFYEVSYETIKCTFFLTIRLFLRVATKSILDTDSI